MPCKPCSIELPCRVKSLHPAFLPFFSPFALPFWSLLFTNRLPNERHLTSAETTPLGSTYTIDELLTSATPTPPAPVDAPCRGKDEERLLPEAARPHGAASPLETLRTHKGACPPEADVDGAIPNSRRRLLAAGADAPSRAARLASKARSRGRCDMRIHRRQPGPTRDVLPGEPLRPRCRAQRDRLLSE